MRSGVQLIVNFTLAASETSGNKDCDTLSEELRRPCFKAVTNESF
jgi:hypothetical protein